MELFWTGRQIHQEVQRGGGRGNATISADMTRGGWMEAGQCWAINFSLGGTWGGVSPGDVLTWMEKKSKVTI